MIQILKNNILEILENDKTILANIVEENIDLSRYMNLYFYILDNDFFETLKDYSIYDIVRKANSYEFDISADYIRLNENEEFETLSREDYYDILFESVDWIIDDILDDAITYNCSDIERIIDGSLYVCKGCNSFLDEVNVNKRLMYNEKISLCLNSLETLKKEKIFQKYESCEINQIHCAYCDELLTDEQYNLFYSLIIGK